jgi:hypothetical protein
MGMETLIHFMVGATDICGRVSPDVTAQPGRPIRLMADLARMHLLEGESGRVV